MKIKVIDIFCDKFTGEVYNPVSYTHLLRESGRYRA